MTDRSREDNLCNRGQGQDWPAASRAQGAPASDADNPSATDGGHSSWHTLVDRAKLRMRRRGHERRRVTVLVLLALLALLVGGYRYMTSDKQIERQAEEFLSDFFQTPVRISSASFSFFEGVQVEGLRVEMEGQEEPIFAARRLRLSHDPLALLTGRLIVREIIAVNPTINLLSRDNQWNFQRLMPKGQVGSGPPQRPVVYVEDGVVNVRQFQDEQLIYQHSLQMSGVLQPASGQPNVFTFFASEIESGTVRGSISRGLVNMAEGTFSFEARATNVELTPALAQALPPEARQVWNRFMPSGMVSLKVVFRDDRSDERGFGFWVEADLNGVALAYEHGGQRFHLEDLTGQCVISRDLLILHDVHGVLTNAPHDRPGGPAMPRPELAAGVAADPEEDGSPVSITVGLSGEVRGIDREQMGYDLEITAGDLDLLRMRRFATRMSPVMQSLYDDFEPAGRADVHLWAHRGAGVDSEAKVRGNIALRSGRCQTYWFPYPIDDVYGDITLEPGAVFVNLSGRNGEARITAVGEVAAAAGDAGIKLHISARRLDLDDKLRMALGQRYPGYVGFYDSLSPEGLIDLEIQIDRSVGGDYEIVNTIHLHDAALTYAQFPYRLNRVRGQVIISENLCTVDIAGRHGPAAVGIEGKFAVGGTAGSGKDMIDLMVVGRNVPLDDDLAQALPAEHRPMYQRYHPEGMADLVIRAHRSADTRGELIYHTRIALRNARMLFEDFPYPIEGVSGELEIAPGAFVLHDLRGTNSGATISASGRVDRRGDGYMVDIMLRGRQLLLDRDLLGALAQHSPSLWNDLELSGKVDAAVHLTQKNEPGAALETEISLASDNLSLMYRPLPYRFINSTADAHFDGRTLTIRQLTSRSGETQLSTSGTIKLGEGGAVESRLSIAASALELDEALLEALPAAMAKPLRRISARGRIDLKIPEITYVRTADGLSEVAWSGTAVVGQGRIDIGLTLDRIVAYVEQSGSYRDGQLSLNAELTMPQGRIAGNEVENLRASFRQIPGSEAIEVVRLEGEMYGGKLEGGGFVRTDDNAEYALQVNFRGVDVEKFVRRGMQMDATIEGGTLSGEVALQGGGSSFDALRARGSLRVRNTKMYRLPVIIQLLSALRLKSGANFESADADFVLREGRYTFSRIVLEGPGLSLHGAGHMTSGGEVAMYFTTGAGDGANIIPALSDLAAGLRHELLMVEVTGSVSKPEVQGRVLTQLTAPLRELMALIKEGQAER